MPVNLKKELFQQGHRNRGYKTPDPYSDAITPPTLLGIRDSVAFPTAASAAGEGDSRVLNLSDDERRQARDDLLKRLASPRPR